MRLNLAMAIVIMVSTITTIAQNSELQKATLIQTADYVIEVPSIASQLADGSFIPSEDITKEYNSKKRGANNAVPGKGLPFGADPLWQKQIQTNKIKGNEPILSFEAASANATPTDPTGAVGPNHFINAWNSSFRIWDKEGNALTPSASLGTILNGNMGDPIVFYDQFADRFVITQFYSNGFGMAVCQGPDPINDGWFEYQFSTGSSFPDYPKFSLWSDGYYITANKNSNSAGTSEVVYATDREKMLTGDPSAQMIGFPLPNITTSGFFSPLGFNVNGNTAPPAGNAPIVYMQDDSWNGISTDHLKIWNINVNWENPGSSTISDPQIINTAPFDGLFDGGSFSNLEQPSGQDIDALQATIMYMAQYRKFADYNTVVFNFVVDLDGTDSYAGIRWYELRQTNGEEEWEIYQEGTYVQPEGHSAFAGNMCMDVNGNIALAYTIVSPTMYPSLRYTGRFSTDALGVMTIDEESYANGTQSDPSYRYGDYSQMTIDPINENTFWTIGEYFNGGRKNQVGVFKITPDLANDVGIASIDSPENGILNNSEPITVSLRNFGLDDQTNIPISYQIDGGSVVEEVFTGTIAPNTNVQYTFSVPGDFSITNQTYEIFSKTSLSIDENELNDTLATNVKHLFAKDLGVTEVLSPVSGADLSPTEIISVVVKNFGAETLSDFDISFALNDGTLVTEQVVGPLESETELIFTFNQTGDFTAVMNHELFVSGSLPDDSDPVNDSVTAIISNTLCQPELICNMGVGIFALQLGSIDNVSGCSPTGYENFSNLSTNLLQGSSNDLTISTEYGSVFVKTWIDFNDDFVFESNEVVVNDYKIADGQQAGNYTETTNLDIPYSAIVGEHLMRVKTNYNESVPEDPCEETLFGETEDYMVIIDFSSGTSLQNLETNDLVIVNRGNNQFSLSFDAISQTETLAVSICNLQGQTIIYNKVYNINGKYEYDFDMSYAPKGIYLLRLGSKSFGKIKRFVVN